LVSIYIFPGIYTYEYIKENMTGTEREYMRSYIVMDIIQYTMAAIKGYYA